MNQKPAATPVTPLPAASVLLLRDGPCRPHGKDGPCRPDGEAGLEVLMMERHAAMGFAGGAMVFPGGKIDASDAAPALSARARLAAADSALQDFQLGALRELFEEAGILLAVNGDGELVDPGRAAELAARHREDVLRDPASFAAMLQAEGLYLAAAGLVHYAHWITPEPVPRRFDTHFFAVAAPPGQEAVSDGREAVQMAWLRPQAALEMGASGETLLMFPTKLNLQRLAHSRTVQEALAAARQSSVVTVMPKPLVEDGVVYLTIPAAAGYGEIKIRRDDIPEAATGNPGRTGKDAKAG